MRIARIMSPLLALALVLLAPVVANALTPWTLTQLTSAPYDHGYPEVSGDRVVWIDVVGAASHVFVWKAGDSQPTTITNDPHGIQEAAVSGDRVAWTVSDGTHRQVMTWKAGDAHPTTLTADARNHGGVTVSGERVVWESDVGGGMQVFTWKAGDSHPTTVTSGASDHDQPQVSGDRLVWAARVGVYHEIITWKAGDAHPTTLTTDAHEHLTPEVSGNRVAWIASDGTHDQVMTWKAGDAHPTTLTTGAQDSNDVQVSRDRIVWDRSDGAHEQICTWKQGDAHTTTLTADAHNYGSPAVSGDRVVWVGTDTTNWQVYTWKVGDSHQTTLSADAYNHVDPEVSGDRVVWQGWDGQHYQDFTDVLVPAPTSLTIASSATSARVGTQFVLSGTCWPSPALVGRIMHVDVKKPGKSYWSYSSNRVIYAGPAGDALWQYKYTLKAGMAPGVYQFRAVYAADASYAEGTSTVATVVVTSGKIVALTFDDGPWPEQTQKVLDILGAAHIKATFFEIGENVQAHPDLSRLVLADGMVLGNHTQTHRLLGHLSYAAVSKEISEGQTSIYKATGFHPRWFRPPGGDVSATVYEAASNLGVRAVLWTVDPDDWKRPPASVIVSRVLSHVKSGSVVLMHDGGGSRANTIAALPVIINALKAKGYSFVTLDEYPGANGTGRLKLRASTLACSLGE